MSAESSPQNRRVLPLLGANKEREGKGKEGKEREGRKGEGREGKEKTVQTLAETFYAMFHFVYNSFSDGGHYLRHPHKANSDALLALLSRHA